jgi:hypothetical protein
MIVVCALQIPMHSALLPAAAAEAARSRVRVASYPKCLERLCAVIEFRGLVLSIRSVCWEGQRALCLPACWWLVSR